MASKIKGLTVKLFGDASELEKAMEKSKKKAKELQRELGQINNVLKIDPSNNVLYTQKENALSDALKNSQEELKRLKKLEEEARKQFKNGNIGKDEMAALTREIIITEKHIKALETQLRNTSKAASKLSEISANLKKVDEAIEKTKAKIKSIEEAYKIDPRNLNILKQRQDAYTESIELTRNKIRLLKEGQQEAARSIRENGTGKEEYEKFTRELVITENELKKLIKESNTAAKKLKSLSQDVVKLGNKFSDFGDKMTKKVTLPIVGAAGAIVKAGMDIESAMTGVRKTTDLSDSELNNLEDTFRDLSKEMPVSATELAGIAEIAGQLGIEKGNLAGFSEVMSMLGTSTNLVADEAADKLARFMNITGLSHDQVKNLGSAIVYLGNNYATTEAEIVEMGTRLAAQGSLIGLTDAEIMALAASMSAVGLNAEAGGSAMTRILQRLNETGKGLKQYGENLDNIFNGTEYETSDLIKLFSLAPAEMNKGLQELSGATGVSVMHLKQLGKQYVDSQYKLNEFAKVAGTTPEMFAEMFRKKPTEALIQFLKGLKRINNEGGDVSAALEQIGIRGIREKDTIQRLTQSVDLMGNAFEDANREFGLNTALQKEAELRYKDTASQVQIFKNRVNDLAIELSEVLLPIFNDFLERASDFVSKLSELDKETLEQIVKVAGVAAAIGPVARILGGTLTAIGKGGMAIAGITSSLGAAVGAAGEFSAALKGIPALVFTPKVGVLAAIAAIGYVAFQVAKSMKEKTFKSDLFEGLSNGTKEAVGDFLELEKEAHNSLKKLWWGSEKVSKETVDSIGDNFGRMSETIASKLNEEKESSIESLRKMYEGMGDVNSQDIDKALAAVASGYDDQINKLKQDNDRALEILNNAATEKRKLTEKEQQELGGIRSQMKEQGILLLAEEKSEAELILQRTKEQSKTIAAEQAAEVVQKSIEQRDETIENAITEYELRMEAAKALRAEGSDEMNKLADETEAAAESQKRFAIDKANEMHNKVVMEAKQQAGEHVREVDWETGEVLSKWDLFKKTFDEKTDEIGIAAGNMWHDIKEALGNIQEKADEWNIKIDEFEKKVNEKTQDLVDGVVEYFSGLPQRISEGVSDLWDWIKSPFEEAAEKIKNVFDFDIKLPEIKVPKPRVNGYHNFLGMRMPNVEWYKKGAIFTKPTMFSTPYGLKGVGEAGAEAVLPISKLSEIIGDAYKSETVRTPPINISIDNMVVRDEYDIQKISNELFRLIERRNRGVGNV